MSKKYSILKTGLTVLLATLVVGAVVNATTTVGDDVSVGGTLGVAGVSTLTGATSIAGALAANGGITVDTSNFTVNGTTGAVATASTLSVTGTTALTGALTATGGIVVPTQTSVAINGTSTLTVGTGATVLGGTLAVTGATALNGGLTMDTNKFAVADGTGVITLANGTTIDNSTAKLIALGGTDPTNTTTAARVLITPQRTSNAPTVAGDVPENFLEVTGYITGVGALGLGSANTRGIYIDITRPAGTAYNTIYADTQDVGLRVHLTNLATANATSYKMMGLEILARSKSGGNTTNLIGGYIAATNDSSPGAAGNVYGVQANSHNDGVASGNVAALYANDDSMSATGNIYGVLIDANGSGGIVKGAAIGVKSTTGSWNYGLDMDDISAFNTADIRLSSGATIKTGSSTGPSSDVACVTLGSLYLSTGAGGKTFHCTVVGAAGAATWEDLK